MSTCFPEYVSLAFSQGTGIVITRRGKPFAALVSLGDLQTLSQVERSGKTIPLADLQVASIAIAHELVLITGNVKYFEQIMNLKVESWL